jgi:hypothetical protein
MGKKWWPYDARYNNCQDFLANLLVSNNMASSDDLVFIKQDTDILFKSTGKLEKVSNTLTTIGAKAKLLMKGGGLYA